MRSTGSMRASPTSSRAAMHGWPGYCRRWARTGPAMAIEDAAVLAPLLAASPSASHAFSRFAALRRDRVQRVQEISRQNGRVFHMGWPLALARNGVIRIEGPRGHFKRLDWLYGYEPSRGT